jgi:alpha-beta hydrolase superfamily lysophospholipase
VQISTDYVFAGDADEPYAEDAPLAPRSAYGRTKAAGEWAVEAHCPESWIVRTAWLYGAGGGNFVKTMARLAVWEARKRLPAVLVGSSLGALIALEVARRAPAAPLVLIAPALGFGARWIDRLPAGDSIPVFHFGEERQIPIHRRFFEQMARAETDGRPPAVPVISIMGSRDESVPVDQVREVWRRWESSGELAAGSRWIEIAGGDHGLVAHIDRIAAEIREAADLTARPVSRSPC